ncbi:MAG: type I restriction-modification enzyme R subunit C-terminal domain-containing protein [Polyangiaceae bacterium]
MKKLADEPEWKTRKTRIDPKLDARGWTLPPPGVRPLRAPFRSEEEPTDNGPADYALWSDNAIAAIVEAKRITTGPQNVLTQAERYARGIKTSPYDYEGLKCPFLYSTNGETVWFHDVRHPQSRSRKVADFHTPAALREMLAHDFEGACKKLEGVPLHSALRPYQQQANLAIEGAISEHKRSLLVAMATGTGKTFTIVSEVYRLIKAGVVRRVLFLVDRRALAEQAAGAFAAFEVQPGLWFHQTYGLYCSRVGKAAPEEEEAASTAKKKPRFDPQILPPDRLTNPKSDDPFVYVCTIQRMATHILGRDAIFGMGDEAIDDDAGKLDIPIHAFDLVIADECHRGYTAQEVSTWRATLEHFDAIHVGLTATPTSTTSAFFTHKVFEYGYEQAVRDGHLVDYDAVKLRSDVRMNGLFLRPGENVEDVDPETGKKRMDQLEDERRFETTELESKVTSPDSNLKILQEVKKYADAHQEKYGRFPKTLIFAANDLPHTSHANELVGIARDVFGRGDAFVQKITGSKDVDRPLQRIREFRNRDKIGIVVTVDMLSTGVDIPDLEFIVFLRLVGSRVLFDQMIGRGTRKGQNATDKDHFTIFDCFDGTLLAYFAKSTETLSETPAPPTKTIVEIIEDIWANRDRDYNIRCLVKRLQRIDKSMAGEAREMFAAYLPDGDVARYARGLTAALRADFTKEMALLRDRSFQALLVTYPRPQRLFLRAIDAVDTVTSELVLHDAAGKTYKPEDYITQFSRYVRDNPEKIEAVRVLLDRPRDWSPAALTELRQKLAGTTYRFTVENLQKAHAAHYKKALVDIVSMVKHAAKDEEPLLTAAERVERAFTKILVSQAFTEAQRSWLERIREVMRENLSIEQEDFDYQGALGEAGGWGAARRVFGEALLLDLLARLNEAIAA